MQYLSDTTMCGILAKVQEIQPIALKKGYSFHLDASVHNWDDESHISINVAVFYDNLLVHSYDFYGHETEEQAIALVAKIRADVVALNG